MSADKINDGGPAAWRAREAKVKAAIESMRGNLLGYDNQPAPDDHEPLSAPTCGEIRIVLAEIERLNAVVETLRKEAREAEREFQREARGIADEARWQERQSHDGDYGSY